MVVDHIPLENLATFIALHVAFTFFDSTSSSFHIVSKNFLDTELKPLMTRSSPFSTRITSATFTGSIFTPSAWDTTGTQLLQLKTDHGTQLIIWPSRAWYTTVIHEKWPRDATLTLTLRLILHEWSRRGSWDASQNAWQRQPKFQVRKYINTRFRI